MEALDKLKKDYPDRSSNLFCYPLDVTNKESINEFKHEIMKNFKQVNILYNNAGVLHKNPSEDIKIRENILTDTFNANVWGLINTTEEMLPIVTNGGHIINISSGLGRMKFAQSIVDKFMKKDLTVEDFKKLYLEYKPFFINNKIENSDWDMSSNEIKPPHGENFNSYYGPYPISKAFVNAYTIMLAKRLKEQGINIKVNAVTPGRVSTRMGGEDAGRDYLQGAEAAAWLASFPEERNDQLSGNFYNYDKSLYSWI